MRHSAIPAISDDVFGVEAMPWLDSGHSLILTGTALENSQEGCLNGEGPHHTAPALSREERQFTFVA